MKTKFVEDSLKKGKFCFNHPAAFNKWESKDAAQYDPWDAHSAHHATHLMYAPIVGEKDGDPIYGKMQKFADSAIVRLQTSSVKHSPICCFRMIEEHEVTSEEEYLNISLGNTADRIIKEFGHDSYLLIQASPFMERLKQHNITVLAGPVVYKDTLNDYEFQVPEQFKDVVEQLFRKDERYEWQKEFRFVLPPSQTSPVFIELGSIEDIAISGKIMDLK